MRTRHKVIEQFRCEAIRDAAVRVVARKGLKQVTVQDIADEAGVAKGTVYLYFKSRDAIIENAMAAAIDDLLGRLGTTAAEGGNFAGVIERMARTQLQFFEERQDLFRLYLTVAEPLGEKRLRKHEHYRSHIALLIQVIETARPELRSEDTERLAIAIAAVMRDVVLQRMTEKSARAIDDDIEFIRDFICRGVLANKRTEKKHEA
jgi:AcrR family transcriptional regulator